MSKKLSPRFAVIKNQILGPSNFMTTASGSCGAGCGSCWKTYFDSFALLPATVRRPRERRYI